MGALHIYGCTSSPFHASRHARHSVSCTARGAELANLLSGVHVCRVSGAWLKRVEYST